MVVLVVVVMLVQICPDHDTHSGHLLALLLHHQLTVPSVGHREPNTVVLQDTADLRK